MHNTVTIGEFARLSHLSVITLRHYHDVGLLTPAQIDPISGYRRYGPQQVEDAHLIRRLRELDMPVPRIAEVLGAADAATRNSAIAEHLTQMETALGRTAEVVTSLRALLQPHERSLEVEYRTVSAISAVGITDTVPREEVSAWCGATFPVIYQALAAADVDPAGPGTATYDSDFFELGLGRVVALVPVAEQIDVAGADSLTLPGGRFAIAVHAGSFEEIDRTYGRLGTHVAEHDRPDPSPIREHYLIGPNHTDNPHQFRTEVWWPLTTKEKN